MGQEHVHQWMSEIGPMLGLGEVIEYAEQALWFLAFSDGQVLEAEYDAPSGRLLLSMNLGMPAPGQTTALHRLLLQYNHAWKQTGGVHMALAGDSVVQMLELSSDRLALATLAQALTGLHHNATTWRALLAPAASTDEADPAPSALRV